MARPSISDEGKQILRDWFEQRSKAYWEYQAYSLKRIAKKLDLHVNTVEKYHKRWKNGYETT